MYLLMDDVCDIPKQVDLSLKSIDQSKKLQGLWCFFFFSCIVDSNNNSWKILLIVKFFALSHFKMIHLGNQ